jgi:hypothetical protein
LAQDPAPPADNARESLPAETSAEPLSVRFRLIEKYTLTPDALKPELINTYQVGIRATNKTVIDKPQGAPDRYESKMQMIYTEAPAKVGKMGEVLDAVRYFDTFNLKSDVPPAVPLFKGLKILLHVQPGADTQILSLTEGRSLREAEFAEITRQLFLPQLSAIFPITPVRVGDTWHIPVASARYLVGETPGAEEYSLDGNLIEISKSSVGTALVAVIGVSGEFNGTDGHHAINARIHFTFEPRGSTVANAGAAKSAVNPNVPVERVSEARGAVTKVFMARSLVTSIPDTDDRLKETVTYELVLERRRLPAGNAANATPLVIPATIPVADENNSWLRYDDPAGRFHFRHPQELRIEPGSMGSDIVGLVDRQFRRPDSMTIQLPPKSATPDRDRQTRDPEYHRRTLYAMWEKQKRDVVGGPTGWLPEGDWNPFKRKVYRIEAALKQSNADPSAPRVYSDYYLVLFNTGDVAIVTAMTVQDHIKFRDQAEALIKTLEFTPKAGAGAQPKKPAAAGEPVPPLP